MTKSSFARAMLGVILAAVQSLAAAQAHVELQAHRGGRGLWPENTLAAFDGAIKLGVSALELDVVATKDGVLVVSHEQAINPDLARGADGRYVARPGPNFIDLTLAQVERYDVGRLDPASAYARHFREQKAVDGQRIPRLRDVLELVKASGDPKVKLEIEIKSTPLHPERTPPPERLADMVLHEVDDSGMAARVQILSFDWRTLQEVQRRRPGIDTVYLTARLPELDNLMTAGSQDSPWTAGFQYRQYGSVPAMVKAAGGRYWSSFWRELNVDNVAQARQQGIKVIAWTVNDRAAINAMLDLGVDGIVTDRPDIALEVFRQRHVQW